VIAAVLLRSLSPFKLAAARQAVSRCVPNPLQYYAKYEPLQNHRSDEVAIPVDTTISPTFTGRRVVTIMCNIISTTSLCLSGTLSKIFSYAPSADDGSHLIDSKFGQSLFLNSSLQLLEELCQSIGSCAHGLPLQPLIFSCASLCLFASCKAFEVNAKTI
jgi:hypothetical protein